MKSSNNKLSPTHIGWDTQNHLEEFDHWNKMNNYEFIFKYGCFEEQKYLRERIKDFENPDIIKFSHIFNVSENENINVLINKIKEIISDAEK